MNRTELFDAADAKLSACLNAIEAELPGFEILVLLTPKDGSTAFTCRGTDMTEEHFVAILEHAIRHVQGTCPHTT